MSIVADTYDYVIGVDTHAETHSYVILSTVNGAVVAGPKKFATTEAGLARAIHWSTTTTGADPQQVLAAVEGSGSYGRRLALALTGERITVAEVRPPRRGGPKSDALDAEGAARVVLRTETSELAQPRAGELRQCLALELGTRRAISKEVVADTQRVITLARRFDLESMPAVGWVKPRSPRSVTGVPGPPTARQWIPHAVKQSGWRARSLVIGAT